MSTQHTPTPWNLDDGDSDNFGIFGQDLAPIAYLAEPSSSLDGLRGRGVDAANAAFIVRACNSHEELVQAVRHLIPLVARGLSDGAYDNIAGGKSYAVRVLDASEAALAKATEG